MNKNGNLISNFSFVFWGVLKSVENPKIKIIKRIIFKSVANKILKSWFKFLVCF